MDSETVADNVPPGPRSAARLAMEPLRLERLEKLASRLPSDVAVSRRPCSRHPVLLLSQG